MRGSSTPFTPDPAPQRLEVLYESPTTRVYRDPVAAPGVVFKEPLGPDAAQRLRSEAAMLERLAGTPGVAQLAPGTFAPHLIALADCGGAPLANLLAAGPLQAPTLLDLAARLARCVAGVHAAGIVHRDINPANIVVSPEGEPLLVDFDLAIPADSRAAAPHDGGIVGTLGYVAPEQTGRTGRRVDPRADLYSLGATLYEMATGARPFPGDDALRLVHDHLVREPVPPSARDARVPQMLSAIVMRLLAKAPGVRYESLERRVQARTRELEQMQAQLVATARRAGMAEIANNVLHSVGNILNSINVSTSVLRRTIGESRAEGLARAVALMREHQDGLGRFIDNDPRGPALVSYLAELVEVLRQERGAALDDLDRLARSVDHITYVVSTQQLHSGPSSVIEAARPHELLEEALRMSSGELARGGVAVERRYADVPATALDRQRLLQIVVNLIANAAQAMEGVPQGDRVLTLAIESLHGEGAEGGGRIRIKVRDRGEGITAENLKRLFAHGFTTRRGGHGFGLHSSALAAMEMGGRLTAHSDGAGLGAEFTLDLPLDAQAPNPARRSPAR